MCGQVVLIILDGWGINKDKKNNAASLAKTPNINRLLKEHGTTFLETSGEAAGLPKGTMGNSEVGHLNMGSGRIVYQSLERINKEIEEGSFFQNKAFLAAIDKCKKENSNLHIMGLVQSEGVHAVTAHCIALAKLCKEKNFNRVFVHAFTDGRDTPPKSAETHLQLLQEGLDKNTGRIASLCGRYYAMDRDNRWERIKLAYEMLTDGKAEKFKDWKTALADAYEKGETDEFIVPRITPDFEKIKDKDSVIFFNYRLDRARQLTKALIEDSFSEFERKKLNINFVAFTKYYDELTSNKKAKVAFKEEGLKNLLGEVISKNKIKQLRIAETEKYAHVTFFFNGKKEAPFELEDRILIPSPKVTTYDLKPEMSALKIKEKAIEAMERDYGLIVINFANGDMVGHTGNLEAAIKGCEAVDKCVGEIVDSALKNKKTIIITADHGNCEDMNDHVKTSHTLNKVFFILIGKKEKLKEGTLADIAPTILELMGIKKPKEMTGNSLIVH